MMLSQLRVSLGLETMGLGLGLVAMGLGLGLECVGLGLVLGLEALSLKSKSGKNSGCSGIVQAPILPQWADRAQHFLNVVPP